MYLQHRWLPPFNRRIGGGSCSLQIAKMTGMMPWGIISGFTGIVIFSSLNSMKIFLLTPEVFRLDCWEGIFFKRRFFLNYFMWEPVEFLRKPAYNSQNTWPNARQSVWLWAKARDLGNFHHGSLGLRNVVFPWQLGLAQPSGAKRTSLFFICSSSTAFLCTSHNYYHFSCQLLVFQKRVGFFCVKKEKFCACIINSPHCHFQPPFSAIFLLSCVALRGITDGLF